MANTPTASTAICQGVRMPLWLSLVGRIGWLMKSCAAKSDRWNPFARGLRIQGKVDSRDIRGEKISRLLKAHGAWVTWRVGFVGVYFCRI
jgi:hypothetical protein